MTRCHFTLNPYIQPLERFGTKHSSSLNPSFHPVGIVPPHWSIQLNVLPWSSVFWCAAVHTSIGFGVYTIFQFVDGRPGTPTTEFLYSGGTLRNCSVEAMELIVDTKTTFQLSDSTYTWGVRLFFIISMTRHISIVIPRTGSTSYLNSRRKIGHWRTLIHSLGTGHILCR